MNCTDLCSVQDLLARLESDMKDWNSSGFSKPWFRGVTNVKHTLLPRILREENAKQEFDLTKKFRLMAPGYGPTPETDRLDQWLFLMQHHNAPTRLLDWSENPLVAAFFAAEKAATEPKVEHDAAIYALDPVELNKERFGRAISRRAPFPPTWAPGPTLQTIKIAFGTGHDAWKEGHWPLEKPIAIYPPTIHARIAAQRGCFTLHGRDTRSFEDIFASDPLIVGGRLRKYRIPKEKVRGMFQELSKLSITYASLFPDFDGLAKELRYSFCIDP